MLSSKNFSLRPLATAGTLHLWQAFEITWMPIVIFVLSLELLNLSFRLKNELPVQLLVFLLDAALVAVPLVSFAVLVAGVGHTVRTSRARVGATIFWMWWPTWRFVLALVAMIVGISFGNYLWYNQFRLYYKYKQLQAYDNVDSWMVNGDRIQDAGVVRFNYTVGVDRSRAGCLVNGVTYCIAPIVRDGVVMPGVPQTRSGYHDLFMAGIDCCNCPITDFRCGDWNNPEGMGGFRLLNEHDRRFYRLAAERWSVTWQKPIKHTVFFHWVSEPVERWRELYTRGQHLMLLGFVLTIAGGFLIVVLLNGLLKLLFDMEIAVPLESPAPPVSIDRKPTMPGSIAV